MNMNPFCDLLIASMPGVEIFTYHLPETVREGVLLLHNLNGAQRDPTIPHYKKAKFQAVVRSDNFESGYALSSQIIATFEAVKGHTAGNVLIHFIRPLHDPVAFPKSKGDLVEFSVNFETVFIET
ncbi:MAG: phage tail terminator protein [Candidatus Binatia bacterium]